MLQFKKLATTDELIVYTDGGCKPNPGFGAWSWVAMKDGKVVGQGVGTEEKTTNNRMELTAILAAVMENPGAIIVSDSSYANRGIARMAKWAEQGWMHEYTEMRNGRCVNPEVANKDLWISMLEEEAKHPIHIRWVKGHAETKGNILADELCGKALSQ